MQKVILKSSPDYGEQNILNAVTQCFEGLGGLQNFIKSGDKVFIKANLIGGYEPERSITTHPMLIRIVARLCKQLGADVTIGDSSGGFYTDNAMNKVYKACKIDEAAELEGVSLNQDFTFQEIVNEKALEARRVRIINAAITADVVINMPKYKTHSFTGYTGAVKNMFGIIPGLDKIKMHGQNADLYKFCNFLVDINEYIKPKTVLHIIDAVYGMEGPGPTGGNPKFIGKILASECAYSLDLACLHLTKNKPEIMPLIQCQLDRNLIDGDLNAVLNYIEGDDFATSIVKDYKNMQPQTYQPFHSVVPSRLNRWFYRRITEKPKIRKRKCKGCAKCFTHCPPKAITMANKKAIIDLDKCIRCYCCQELCPYSIVKIKRPFLSRIIDRFTRKSMKKTKKNL